jgi:trimethylamine:corrinoid methyltransferase-like protein
MTTITDDGSRSPGAQDGPPEGRARRRRSSKRGERKAEAGEVRQLPWRRIINPYKPLEILSDDQVEAIHQASLRILEEMGLEFMSPEALDLLKRAGAQVDFDTQMVRFDRALIEETVAKAPSRVTLTPRNPARQVVLGEGHLAFNLVAGPPFVHDCETGRRDGSYGDLCNLLRLAHCAWPKASTSSTWWAINRSPRSSCRRSPGIWTAIWPTSPIPTGCSPARRSAPSGRWTAST